MASSGNQHCANCIGALSFLIGANTLSGPGDVSPPTLENLGTVYLVPPKFCDWS